MIHVIVAPAEVIDKAATPEMAGGCVSALATVILTAAPAGLPAASRATALSVCGPWVALVVSQTTA